MVSEYLNHTRSLEELDALYERDRVAAAKIAATVFKHEVSTAITNIDEINQIANARIQADSQVAAAKMMTNAEVMATHLVAKAEIAVLDIQQQASANPEQADIHNAMIIEISRNTAEDISQSAQASIEEIQHEAREAIKALQANAMQAINGIQNMANEVAAKLTQSAKTAKSKLAEQKKQNRTPENLMENAEQEATKIVEEAMCVSQDLRAMTQKATNNLNTIADQAIAAISEALKKSETRILTARDKAVVRIQDIAASYVQE